MENLNNQKMPMKKRVFSENEQNSGSYNVGMKSNKKKLNEKVKKHLQDFAVKNSKSYCIFPLTVIYCYWKPYHYSPWAY